MTLSIAVTGRDVDITEEMRSQISAALDRVERRLQGFPPDMTQTDVVLERLEKTGAWQVRITLGAGAPDHTFTSTEEGATVAEAARRAAEDIVDQVERFRDKVQRKEHTYEEVRAIKEGERAS
ncbi:MAG TPA: HPF/RaiA family ribosome-associated protein [bacterium]|jgi:ribosomal subunit interface protein|nr:HPF/RaiA family ribosome-associated protein [bacterium]